MKHVGGIICFGAFVFFVDFVSCSPPPSTDSSDSPIITTKYLYEGPDGCNAEECYCRTDTSIQEHADKGLESSRFISVKTLKCVNKTDISSVHYLVMKLPLCMYNSIVWMQQTTAEIWAKVTNGYDQGMKYMVKIKDKVVESVSSLSPYLERMEKNIKRYYRALVGDDDETVLNPTVYQPTKTKGHVENLEADDKDNNNETGDEEEVLADGESKKDNYFDNYFDDEPCGGDGSA